MNSYTHTVPFKLECGATLEGLTIAYHTYGKLNAEKDNCIWVCHALTANSDVADWWPHTVEKGAFLDPDRYFIVCANILGSCYGTTGPLSVDPSTGNPYYSRFPKISVKDVVNAHRLLADHLGVDRIFSLIGASVGGFQAMEWAAEEPERFKSLVLIATQAYASPWAIALDEAQRMAILSDKTYGDECPSAGKSGLAAARAIGMLSYRGPKGYNLTQQNPESHHEHPWPVHRAVTYQQHQGKKLANRFNAYSYMNILDMFDTHNIGRKRGGIDKALAQFTMPVLVIGITTDIIFTPEELKEITVKMPGADYREIESAFGHDGFLVEYEALNSLIKDFFASISEEVKEGIS